MNKFARKVLGASLATVAVASQAAVPAGVEAAITAAGTDVTTVVGYMIVAAVAIWGVMQLKKRFG